MFLSNRSFLNAVSLLWGVRGFYYDNWESTDNTIIEVNDILKSKKLVKQGDILINTAAIPMEAKGKTNMLKITVVD